MQPGNLRAHEQAVSSVAFHRIVQVMATASADGSFKVFTSHSSAQPDQLVVKGQPHDSFITCARFSPVVNF